MKRPIVPAKQQMDLPHFAVDTAFVQVLSGQLRDGLIAQIGPSALAVWLIIRTFARHRDGRAYVQTKDIQKLTGLSHPTTKKAVKTLVDANLMRVCEDGKKRRYYLFDRLPYVSLGPGEDDADGFDRMEMGERDGMVEIKYVPALASTARSEIAAWAGGGPKPSVHGVQFVGLQAVQEANIEVARVKTLVVERVELADGTLFDPSTTFGKKAARILAKKTKDDDEGG